MLDTVCGEIRNYFEKRIERGTFTIRDGVISPDAGISQGQYFRIVGSVFNDGVHKYPGDALVDEEFEGEVWAMAVPATFAELVGQIEEYEKSEGAKPSAYTSESFGGYKYTRAGGDNGVDNSWQKVFAGKLNRWRRI